MNYKIHGSPNKIILHGGPGAPGSVSGLAKGLNNCIELYNKGQSIEAQLTEIHAVVSEFKMDQPVLVGHSWGAWLAFLYAAKYKTSKIVLVGCGAFKNDYLNQMNQKRQAKLSDHEQVLVNDFFKAISEKTSVDMVKFGYLMAKMDSYDMLSYDDLTDGDDQVMAFDQIGHDLLMKELRVIRSDGSLLQASRRIKAEVLVIHGKDDPHPVSGVVEPFKEVGLLHQVYILDKCGHTPWQEIHAKQIFFDILLDELT